MSKLPMGKDPKTGKMVPKFAMDGKGKMAKGGSVKMAKGGAVKMAGGGPTSLEDYMGGQGAAKLYKNARESAAARRKANDENFKRREELKKRRETGKATPKQVKKMAGGGMAKGYKAGGVATKGGTKGGATGGKKVAKKRDGIARRGKTRA